MALQITSILLIVAILGSALRWAMVQARIPFRWGRVLGLSFGLFSLSLPFYYALAYHRPESLGARVTLAVGAAYLPVILGITLLILKIARQARRGHPVALRQVYWWLRH